MRYLIGCAVIVLGAIWLGNLMNTPEPGPYDNYVYPIVTAEPEPDKPTLAYNKSAAGYESVCRFVEPMTIDGAFDHADKNRTYEFLADIYGFTSTDIQINPNTEPYILKALAESCPAAYTVATTDYIDSIELTKKGISRTYDNSNGYGNNSSGVNLNPK